MEGDFMNLRQVIAYWTEGEINIFIKVWLSAYVSLSYCYLAGKSFPKGIPRLVSFLPVICLFLLLPLPLHSVHLTGITAFFLTWLANFKLLLFAFDLGPLSNPSITALPKFVSLACLPIKLQTRIPPPKSNENGNQNVQKQHSFLNYAVKTVLLSLILKSYDYDHYMHPRILIIVYSFHIYLCLEMILAVAAFMARTLLGAELEPQFDEPYLSTSLQDFWGRRWNLMVTRILRPTVYIPVLNWSGKFMGRKWAGLPAVMATFVVSGLMHELIFYYLGRVRPTWEITWFFLLHGACLMMEIVVKKALNGRWRLPRFVGTILTLGFVFVTVFWLFFPQFLRCEADKRGLAEIAAVGKFVEDVVRAFYSMVNSKQS